MALAATPTVKTVARAITLSVPPAELAILTALVASLVASDPLVTTHTGPLAKVVALTAPVASLSVAAVSVLPATTRMALPAVILTVPVVSPVANLVASVVTRAEVASGKSVEVSDVTY